MKLEHHIKGSLPIEGDWWQVGAIVGRSGSGKSTVAKRICFCPVCHHLAMAPTEAEPFLCPKCQELKVESEMIRAYIPSFHYEEPCVLEDFPENLETKEITKTIGSVGFASPPDWLKRYGFLSQGEKMRVDVARALLLDQELIVFDEFTSVVDREVAKIGSIAVGKAVRRQPGKKFIAVTCHSDVVDWLGVDWYFNMDNGEFVKKNDVTQQLSSRFIGVALPSGKCFGSIIISAAP